jgi:hypothetical protein
MRFSVAPMWDCEEQISIGVSTSARECRSGLSLVTRCTLHLAGAHASYVALRHKHLLGRSCTAARPEITSIRLKPNILQAHHKSLASHEQGNMNSLFLKHISRRHAAPIGVGMCLSFAYVKTQSPHIRLDTLARPSRPQTTPTSSRAYARGPQLNPDAVRQFSTGSLAGMVVFPASTVEVLVRGIH